MIKKLFFILSVVAIAVACGNQPKKSTEKALVNVQAIGVDSFLKVAPTLVGQEVTVKGTVKHVCRHTGKRIQLFQSCPDESIQGTASDSIGQFDVALEGSDVCITGTVEETRIDKAYVDEWESKLKQTEGEQGSEPKMEQKEGTDHHANLDKVVEYRKQIEESPNGYISFYSIQVNKLAECKSEQSQACCHKGDSMVMNADTNKVSQAGCGGCKHEKECGK